MVTVEVVISCGMLSNDNDLQRESVTEVEDTIIKTIYFVSVYIVNSSLCKIV